MEPNSNRVEIPVEQHPGAPKIGGGYAWYVLGILVIVYVFNFIDRGILSILAEDIKADLDIDDAQIGFLYGTAFAVFYAVFGIPLARLADVWTRRKLIAIGLFFWSGMTALSGTARGLFSLGAYRIGVGIGESSASPAAFSMLCDYFPPSMRATAVAIYSSGVYIGAGLGIFIGGWILDWWAGLYPNGDAPFGLAGWQAAFFVVGLPGLVMAVWVWTLKEPVRGLADGMVREPNPADTPMAVLGRELGAVIPPFTFARLFAAGGGRAVAINGAFLAGFCVAAYALTATLGTPAQWWALALGLYCVTTWVQNLTFKDPAAFTMIFKSRAMVFGMLGFGLIAFKTYGVGFWFPPYFIRAHGVSPGEAGMYIGLASAIGGWTGVTFGGVLSDWLKRYTPNARILCGYCGALLCIPFNVFTILTDNTTLAYFVIVIAEVFSSMWIGSAVALANELVLPRMRATASSFYILVVTFVGLALGPYTIGQLSVVYGNAGASSADALQRAMLTGMSVLALAVVALFIAGRYVAREEKGLLDRARAAGEPVNDPGTAGEK